MCPQRSKGQEVMGMRILIAVTDGPENRLLVKLHGDNLVNDVIGLISKNRHQEAMAMALIKGSFVCEVAVDDVSITDADLMLFSNRASWNIAA
jgi:hypothetical protein